MTPIPSSAELEAGLQRKMLWLLGPTFCGLGVFYFSYAVLSGVPRFPWASSALFASGLAGIAWAFFTGSYLRGIQIISVGVFGAFSYSSAHQYGIYSSSLWWMVLPPVFLLLAGSLRLGVLAGVLLLVFNALLAWHGPQTMGSVTLTLLNPHLQLLVAELVSSLVLLLVTGMSVLWRIELQQALESARAAASAAAEAKARFLANMSHEIRTPLNGVMGTIELMRSFQVSDEQRTQLLALQDQSAKALLALVNDVLDWSKIEAGKVRLESAPVDPRALVFESNELFAVTAFDKGLELTSSCAPDVPRRVLGDATRLRQIVNNLVGNAVKFTHAGGVHIHVSLAEAASAAAGGPGARQLAIEVADTGIGMAPEQVRELFTAFHQADASVTRRYGGTGLGLAISAELAQLMGGAIAVASEPGRGSRFTLTWPLQTAGGAASEVQQGAGVPGIPQRRPDVLLACASEGLERHMRSCLHALDIDPETMLRLPDAAALRGRLLLVDARLLAGAGHGWLEAHAREAGGLIVMAPLNGDTMPGTFPQGRILYKPVSQAALAQLLEPMEAAGTHSGDTVARAGGGPPRVLLCEDNPVNQVIVQAMLNELGATCRIADDGEEALRCLDEERFDLVLMDVQMPVLDGLAATRRWRAREAGSGAPRTPIVAVTAGAEDEKAHACLDAGMDGLLPKPFGIEALRACLATHADVSRAAPRPMNRQGRVHTR